MTLLFANCIEMVATFVNGTLSVRACSVNVTIITFRSCEKQETFHSQLISHKQLPKFPAQTKRI